MNIEYQCNKVVQSPVDDYRERIDLRSTSRKCTLDTPLHSGAGPKVRGRYRRHMNCTVLLFMGVIAMWACVPRLAQAQTGSGFYLSSEFGVHVASSLGITGSSNDRASVCDEFINPMYAMVTTISGYESYNCTGPNRGSTGDWKNNFDSAMGLLAGTAVGYSFQERYPDHVLRRLRLELEYFYRNSGYDQISNIPTASGESSDKLVQEIVIATDRIYSITSHNLFGNLYFDFVNNSRFTPYLGFGGGIGFTDMDYGSVWARNFDENRITTGGEGLSNVQEIYQEFFGSFATSLPEDFTDAVGPSLLEAFTNELGTLLEAFTNEAGTPLLITSEGLPNAQEIHRNLAGTVSVAETKLSDMPVGYQVLLGVDYALTESMSLGVKGRWVNFGSFSDGGVIWDPLRGHVPNLRRDGSEPVSGEVTTRDMSMFGVSVNLKCSF